MMARIFRDFAKLFSVANLSSVCYAFAVATCLKNYRAVIVARMYAYLHAIVCLSGICRRCWMLYPVQSKIPPAENMFISAYTTCCIDRVS